MNPLAPILWVEGTLLSQQHLQYWQDYLLQHINWQGIDYGVGQLQIDELALNNNEFIIINLLARFRNNIVVTLQNTSSSILKTSIPATISTTVIYLALPIANKIANVTGYTKEETSELVKMTAHYGTYNDIFDANRQAQILTGQYNIQLLLASEVDKWVQQNYELLPIAKVVRSQSGTHLDNDFIVPCLWWQTLPNLARLVYNLQQELMLLQHNFTTLLKSSSNLLLKLSAMELYKAGLSLKQLLTYKEPPFALYKFLVQLSINLTAITETPLNYPEFTLEASGKVFTDLFKLIKQQLNIISAQMKPPTLFKKVSAVIYEAPLELPIERLLLAVEWATNGNWSNFYKEVKVAALNDLDHLVQLALPGISITPYPVEPTLGRKEYFILDAANPLYANLQQSAGIGVYIPVYYPLLSLELVSHC